MLQSHRDQSHDVRVRREPTRWAHITDPALNSMSLVSHALRLRSKGPPCCQTPTNPTPEHIDARRYPTCSDRKCRLARSQSRPSAKCHPTLSSLTTRDTATSAPRLVRTPRSENRASTTSLVPSPSS